MCCDIPGTEHSDKGRRGVTIWTDDMMASGNTSNVSDLKYNIMLSEGRNSINLNVMLYVNGGVTHYEK